jgi:hypothetical protein
MISKLLFENFSNLNVYNQIAEALKEAATAKGVDVTVQGPDWDVVYSPSQQMSGCDYKEEIEAKAIAI